MLSQEYVEEIVSAEITENSPIYQLKHIPIPGTIQGSFEVLEKFHSFIVDSSGKMIIDNKILDTSLEFNILNIEFNHHIFPDKINISYEYEAPITSNRWDEKFNECSTVSCINYNTLLGDTIKGKYEEIITKLYEITEIMKAKGTSGYFWIVTGPIILEFMQTFSYLKEEKTDHIPMGKDVVIEKGILNTKWKVYTADDFPSDKILIGVDDWKTCEGKDLASIKIDNLMERV